MDKCAKGSLDLVVLGGLFFHSPANVNTFLDRVVSPVWCSVVCLNQSFFLNGSKKYVSFVQGVNS